jgi:class 3 adenylate cyclase
MPWMNFSGELDSVVDGSIAGKASVAGATAAQKLKVIRMVRLVRLAKLYKYLSTKQSAKQTGPAENSVDIGLDHVPAESHVGAEMSDRTTKKVIIGILVMLIGIPLLSADEVVYSNEFSMNMVLENRLLLANEFSNAALESWEFSESLLLNTTKCIDIKYRGFDDGLRKSAIIPVNRNRPADLRKEEKNVITISAPGYSRTMTSTFDASERVREEALLGILLTSFIIVLLGLGMISFTKDVRNLVIVPIEKMIQLVREISENPLGKDFSLTDDNNKDDMETTVLIRTISKIAGLMRVGFGEAGADIIGKNLNITTGTENISFLGNGRKIQSIFGFCDVRQFTDTTECLQEEVMLFVNRIAHILHSIVVQCDGAANKNIGDAFLLTWRIQGNTAGSVKDHKYAGDKALYSFIKTMIEMCRHEDFLCNFSPKALSELYERMPGYKCRIGCGLHFGWAIEGAIGSSKKIDASYISPHVNMSETLESSTKEYGVPLLMSEPFYNLLSQEAISGCRKVDVINKGKTGKSTGCYTYDVDLSVGFSENVEPVKKSEPIHQKKLNGGFSLVGDKKKGAASKVRQYRDGTSSFIVFVNTLMNFMLIPELK